MVWGARGETGLEGEPPVVISIVGGKGTRMYPVTLIQPKPLLPICNYAVLNRGYEILAHQGCRDFIFASKGVENTLRLKEYFRWGRDFSQRLALEPPARFRYQPNYADRGNADAVRKCIEYYNVEKDVLVVSGDNILDVDVEKVMEHHRRNKALLTVGLKEIPSGDISHYGVADISGDLRIKRFVEKPKAGEEPSRLINTGIYVFSPQIKEVFKKIPEEKVRDIGGHLIPCLTEKGFPVYGYITEGYWADVGTPGKYLETTLDILSGKVKNIKFRDKDACGGNRWIHPTTIENLGGNLEGKVHIGEHVLVGGDTSIGEGTFIADSCVGDNCIIGRGTRITNSVVMDFTNIGDNVRLNGCIVGRFANIEDSAIIDRDLEVEVGWGHNDLTPVIGDNVIVVRGSVIGPKKRVAPLRESHRILRTRRFIELGMDRYNIYFVEG